MCIYPHTDSQHTYACTEFKVIRINLENNRAKAKIPLLTFKICVLLCMLVPSVLGLADLEDGLGYLGCFCVHSCVPSLASTWRFPVEYWQGV